MRTKDQILDDTLRSLPKTPAWDATASLHERLTIEVLVDIRDILKDQLNKISYNLPRQTIPH